MWRMVMVVHKRVCAKCKKKAEEKKTTDEMPTTEKSNERMEEMTERKREEKRQRPIQNNEIRLEIHSIIIATERNATQMRFK